MYFAYCWALTTWHAIDTHSISFFYICQEHVSDPCFSSQQPLRWIPSDEASHAIPAEDAGLRGGCNFPRWNLPTAGSSLGRRCSVETPRCCPSIFWYNHFDSVNGENPAPVGKLEILLKYSYSMNRIIELIHQGVYTCNLVHIILLILL